MTDYTTEYTSRILSDYGAALLRDGASIYVNGATGLPNRFMQMLGAKAVDYEGIRLYHPMRRAAVPLEPDPCGPTLENHLFHVSDFTYDEVIRNAVRDGRAAYRPAHSSDGGKRFPYPIDLLVAAAAPMDEHGFFNLGAFGGWIRDFFPHAQKILLEINPRQPHVFGDNYLHVSRVAGVWEAELALIELPQSVGEASATERKIASVVGGLIEDGSTIQVGAGTLPEAVITQLSDSGIRDLGVHTESYFDWVIGLYEAGVITNARKSLDPGTMIAAMGIGSGQLYRFMTRNPSAQMRPFSYVNDPRVIAQGFRPVSINATLQIDLQGQCASEGFGSLHHGGIGGQWNFHYGAGLADQGKGIIALPSTAKGGTVSRIVSVLPAGTAVSISRNDIHWVATEFGAVELRGKSLDDRARALISIAHPAFRDELLHAARSQLHVLR